MFHNLLAVPPELREPFELANERSLRLGRDVGVRLAEIDPIAVERPTSAIHAHHVTGDHLDG